MNEEVVTLDTQKALVVETINAMREARSLFRELEIKDKIIQGNKGIFRMFEADLAKLVVKEYESCLKMVRYLGNENEQLKYLTQKQERQIDMHKMEVEQARAAFFKAIDKVKRQNEDLQAFKNKIFSL